MTPLVSVICLCYNQGKFIAETVESVMQQDYPVVECFIVDDGSTDNSREQIRMLGEKYPSLKIVFNEQNLGMCASFNKALALATGEYVIDLAADDVLHRSRIAQQVNCFQQLPKEYGVVFTDAWLMDEEGMVFGCFYPESAKVPSGDVFAHVLRSYFICSPTIMVKRAVLNELGGYNPELAYEDYDLFVRSARKHRYHFLNEKLTFRRVVKGSDSSRWYKAYENPHLNSTYQIHLHAQTLIGNEAEMDALAYSVGYHWRQSVLLEVRGLIPKYFDLLRKIRSLTAIERFLYAVARFIPLSPFYRGYLWMRNGIKKALQKRAFKTHYSKM